MTRTRLLLQNLSFHWRGNLAVLLGVAVGTAVLTGALLVADSLRGSLRQLTLKQLGWVEDALISGRFVREKLADEIDAEHVAPVLILQGSARAQPEEGSLRPPRRAGNVVIFGVNERFWYQTKPPMDPLFWSRLRQAAAALAGPNAALAGLLAPEPAQTEDSVVLNKGLADELGAQVGDTVALFVQKATQVPRETLLGRRDEVVDEVLLKVTDIVPDDSLGGSFNLNPRPGVPRNAFVPLHTLQAKLDIGPRVNALLVSGARTDLNAALARHLTLEDWGLLVLDAEARTNSLFAKVDRNRDGKLDAREWQRRFARAIAAEIDKNNDRDLTRAEVFDYYQTAHPYLAVESKQMILEAAQAEAALKAAAEVGLRAAPTMVYLANSIASAANPDVELPYSVVAALDAAEKAPLGPFLPAGVDTLKDDEIVLVDWDESPLKPMPGEKISVKYFLPEHGGKLEEKTETFTFKGFVPLKGVTLDPDLTPEFPGITDKLSITEWRPPFKFEPKRVKKRDEDYWEKYRTTPKAFVTLKTGRRLWGSRFGDTTTLRLAPTLGDLVNAKADFDASLLRKLDPAAGGLRFEPIRARALAASERGTDFSILFLGFSFFLILAALLLVGLLFRLNLERRSDEIGLLLATGFNRRAVRNLLLLEGGLVAALGAIVGSAAAVAYAWLVVELFAAIWPTAQGFNFLRLHTTPASFALGYAAALLVSLVTIAWAVRALSRVAPAQLLHGGGLSSGDTDATPGRRRFAPILLWVSLIGAIGCAVGARFIRDHEAQAGTFFGSGGFLLTFGLTALWLWMRRARHRPVHGEGSAALARLGSRNATRNPVRSLLTAGLLAASAFVVVAVDSFRRVPATDFLEKTSGSGGFNLVAESSVPLYEDISTPEGQDAMPFSDPTRAALAGVKIVNLRVRAGDDASCLNLYSPGKPRLLGVPPELIERGGFHFQATAAASPEEKQNPWLLLDRQFDDGAIPVFGEANTVMWQLKLLQGVGGTLEVPDGRGKPVKLRVVGLLKDSVFQSELLMSEANFLELYPGHEGFNYFLIATPPARADAVAQTLQDALADRGFVTVSAEEKLRAYLAVENTYISTFQALGGLGVLLGALGLAVVLLRSVWERRGELALLRALGYRHSALGRLVLAENVFLLTLGLIVGSCAALLAVAPHLIGQGAAPSWLRLLGLLLVVVVVGLSAGGLAVRAALRTPLLPALRKE